MAGFDDKTAREMVQAMLVGRIFAANVGGELALKGGMAFRVAAGSNRLTKDIDLMSPPGVARAEARIKSALTDLRVSGMVEGLVVTQPKRTDTTWRWKIGGRVGATTLNLTVEVSRRSPLPTGHVNRVSWSPPAGYGMAPVMVDCLDMPMLAATKVSCLVDPSREAPRDLFDMHLLIVNEIRPPIAALKAMGRERLEQGMINLWSKIEKMDYAAVETELLPHLDPAARGGLTAEKWDDMRVAVAVKVQSWLLEAIDDDWDRAEMDAPVTPEAAPEAPGFRR